MTSDSPWLEVKQRYAARIRRFEETHLLGSRWISFRRINDWSVRKPQDFPNYAQITDAILASKFNANGRSQILFLWVDNVLIGQKADALFARPAFRFSVEEFRQAFHQATSVLEAEYLSRFWVPRAVCARWFRDEGYPLPPWLQSGESPPKVAANGDQAVLSYVEAFDCVGQARFGNVWCLSLADDDRRDLGRAPPSVAESSQQDPSGAVPRVAVANVKNWLISLMKQSPTVRRNKDELFREARERFGANISRRSFDNTYTGAIDQVPGCKWNTQGRTPARNSGGVSV
jgi:hypothetical protein